MLRSPMTMSASPRDERREQQRDVRADVLVVGVGVDDEVGAELERGVDAGDERGGQALAAAEAHDVVHAVGARDVRRAVTRAVVDDEDLDAIDAGEASAADRASVAGSVSASLRHGIWMMSFGHSGRLCADQPLDDAVPGHLRRAVVAGIAERRVPAGGRREYALSGVGRPLPASARRRRRSRRPRRTRAVRPSRSAVTTGLRARNASSVT